MSDENEKKEELDIEEITLSGDELEEIAGGTCAGCTCCSTKPPLNQQGG